MAHCLYAQKVERLDSHTAKVSLENGQIMYLDFYGTNIFRLFHDPNGGEMRDPEANPPANILVNNPRKEVTISVKENTVTTENISLSIDTKEGNITVSNKDMLPLCISAADFQKGKTSITLSKAADEYFYGGGVQNGRFSHAGKSIAIENTNNWVDGGVASPTPFYWSTAGYGVMGYTFEPGRYDFGSKDKSHVRLMHETDYLDYFFMFDKGAVALLNDFYQLTGNPVLLPKFGFYEGHLNAYNRDYWTEVDSDKKGYGFMPFEDGKVYKESQKNDGGIRESLNGELNNYQFSARAAIDRYNRYDMPLGWFLPNDGYGAGYGQTSTLEGNVQNLKEFGEYARSKGVEIGLWTQSDLHPVDSIEALLQRDIVREVRDAGVRVLKTDVAWVGAGYSFGLNGVEDVGNIMPQYGNDARPFIISLDGWAGTQRYAGIWSGDQTGGEWEYIRFHIPTYIGSGLSGQPNITSDMDGIFGGRNMVVNVRDFQWKTFTPMELNMDGWGSNPKYPFALGEPATSINRWYLKLKSRLMPYTYSIAHEAINGKPIMRAMMLEEENPYTLGSNTQYQFMYGPYILVAPIYKQTLKSSDSEFTDDIRNGIYLPKGQWIDYFTGEVYEGGRIINDYAAPLWKLPIFIKRGAIIPTHKSTNNPSQMDAHLRCYDIYPYDYSKFTEYDDDGVSQAYLRGENVTTHVTSALIGNSLRVQVLPARGNYKGYEPMKSTQLRIYCSSMPEKIKVKVRGKKVKLTHVFDYETCLQTPNSYYYGASTIDYMKIPTLMVNIAQMDVRAGDITLEAKGVNVDTTNSQLTHHGPLTAPKASVQKVAAYTLTPQWESVEGADYYEIEFDGQIYSTIQGTSYELDNLTPDTDYSMKVRAVNADGQSAWTNLSAKTTTDPLQWAIRGIRGTTSCENQGGQEVRYLFDFDEGTTWHTKWSDKAVPFDLIVDLRSVNSLDKLQYLPRLDAGNGTILEGTIAVSMDQQKWSEEKSFRWERNSKMKEFDLSGLSVPGSSTARYIRVHVTKAFGDFGSGIQMYVFRKEGSDYYVPGDINQDGRIDENDLTSYMNYTGLRRGDSDFGGYVEKGDLNTNGLIDAYDISAVGIELESGVSSRKVPSVEGTITYMQTQQGNDIYLTVSGKNMKSVNAVSMAVPYNPSQLEYVGIEAKGVAQMQNLTKDRLHTNGKKSLYPTFVNIGEQKYTEGNQDLFVIHFRAKNSSRISPLKPTDGMILDKYMNVVKF